MKIITLFLIAILAPLFGFATPPTGTITTSSISGIHFPGSKLSVGFTTSFAPQHQANNPSNYFITYFQVELSDANGNFGANPTVITQNTTIQVRSTPSGPITSGTILGVKCNETNMSLARGYTVNAQLPFNLPAGTYRVRVVSRQEFLFFEGSYGPTTPISVNSIYPTTASSSFRVSSISDALITDLNSSPISIGYSSFATGEHYIDFAKALDPSGTGTYLISLRPHGTTGASDIQLSTIGSVSANGPYRWKIKVNIPYCVNVKLRFQVSGSSTHRLWPSTTSISNYNFD